MATDVAAPRTTRRPRGRPALTSQLVRAELVEALMRLGFPNVRPTNKQLAKAHSIGVRTLQERMTRFPDLFAEYFIDWPE